MNDDSRNARENQRNFERLDGLSNQELTAEVKKPVALLVGVLMLCLGAAFTLLGFGYLGHVAPRFLSGQGNYGLGDVLIGPAIFGLPGLLALYVALRCFFPGKRGTALLPPFLWKLIGVGWVGVAIVIGVVSFGSGLRQGLPLICSCLFFATWSFKVGRDLATRGVVTPDAPPPRPGPPA